MKLNNDILGKFFKQEKENIRNNYSIEIWKKMFTKWSIFLKSMYVFHFITLTNLCLWCPLKRNTDRLSYLSHHKRLQMFEMSSPFTAILSYFNLKALYNITVQVSKKATNQSQINWEIWKKSSRWYDIYLVNFKLTGKILSDY